MAENDTLVAAIAPAKKGQVSQQFVGLPPMEAGEPDARARMNWPRVVVLLSLPDGVFLERFTEAGHEAGDTWHLSIDDAKSQAEFEYGAGLGPWTVLPQAEGDAVAFALRLAQETT